MPRVSIVATATLLLTTSIIGGCTRLKLFLYEGMGRDDWQHAQQVVRVLEIEPGTDIADLGAGGGYFTFPLADATGPRGRVYAIDVDRGMIGHLTDRVSREGYANVHPILARSDDPRLPQDGVDLIFVCNTYHHISDRIAYFARARRALRPGGRVVIIEDLGRGLFGSFGHATKPERIRTEMEAAGYQRQGEFAFLPRQSFQIFTEREP